MLGIKINADQVRKIVWTGFLPFSAENSGPGSLSLVKQ
jgi:hypothetical protein